MIQRLLIAGLATALALPAHASDMREFLPDVFIWKDGRVVTPVELKAQCIRLPYLNDKMPCLDVPGGGRIFLPIGRIPVPPAEGNPFSLGAVIFEDFPPETRGTLLGSIGFGLEDEDAPLFELPLVFTFGSVTFERTVSNVFSFDGRDWQARTAGIGESGQFRLEEIPTSENGTDLFAMYLPFGIEPVNRVPEPSAAALMLVGLAGLVGLRRRRG